MHIPNHKGLFIMKAIKTEQLNITVPSDVVQAARDLAAREERSLSKMTSMLVAQALRSRGALKDVKEGVKECTTTNGI